MLSFFKISFNSAGSKLTEGIHYVQYYSLLLKQIDHYIAEVIAVHQETIQKKLRPIRYNFPVSFVSMIRALGTAIPEMHKFVTALDNIYTGIIQYCSGKYGLLTRKIFHKECSLLFKGFISLNKFLKIEEFVPVIKEEEIYNTWENEVLEHVKSSNTHCLILWIDDNPVEEVLIEREELAAVISRKSKDITAESFENLEFLSDSNFEGRFRIGINSSEPDIIIKALNHGPFKEKFLDIIINKEQIPLEAIEPLLALRDDIVLSAGTIGFVNFVKMSTLLWIGPLEDAELESALRKNGVVMHIAISIEDVLFFLSFSRYLRKVNNFRVVIIEEAVKMEISNIIVSIRQFSPCPILIRINSVKDFDYTVHEFPFIKETFSDNELASFGCMNELHWAKTDSLFWNPSKKAHKNKMMGELIIHSISCSNLYSSGKDQFIVFYLNGEKQEKTKTLKEANWSDLNWNIVISSSDTLKFEVHTNELLSANFEGQIEINLGVLVPLPVDQLQFTKILKESDLRKARKVRGTMTINLSFKAKGDDIAKHFGKPLGESLAQSDRDKVLHVTDKVIYNFMNFHLEDEGVFRLPGNTVRVKALRAEIDNSIDNNWDNELVHDVGSLYKMYFSALSEVDTLLPSAMYNEYKAVAKSDPEEKIRNSGELIGKLPEPNQRILITLLDFLKTISLYSEINKMTPKNLAVCFAPTIIIPQNCSSDPATLLYDSHQVTEYLAYLIDHISEIFPVVSTPNYTPLSLDLNEEEPEVEFMPIGLSVTDESCFVSKKTLADTKRSQFARTRATSAPLTSDPNQRKPTTTPKIKQKSGSPQLNRTPNEKKKHMLKHAVFSKKNKSKSVDKHDKSPKERNDDEDDENRIKRNASEQIVADMNIQDDDEQSIKHKKKLVRLNTKSNKERRISIKADKKDDEDFNIEYSTRDEGKHH